MNTHVCPAPDQGDVCGACRACWNNKIKNVMYWLHQTRPGVLVEEGIVAYAKH